MTNDGAGPVGSGRVGSGPVGTRRTGKARPSGLSPSVRWPMRNFGDVLAVAGASAVLVVVLGAEPLRSALPVVAGHQILTSTAAATGAAAAILAVVASRLFGDPRPAWTAAALVLFLIVVLPWATILPNELDTARLVSRLVAYSTVLVLLVMSLRPPRVLGAWGAWVVMLTGGLLSLAALGVPDTAAVRAVVATPTLTAATLVGWVAVAVRVVVDAYRRHSTPRLRLGLGLAVLATAQLYRVVTGTAATVDIAFAALRLLGLVIVLVGLAQLVQRALLTLRSEHWQQQEELVQAALHLERAGELAAERHHELRNGLAGLAGITRLLSTDTGGPDHGRLRHAALAELGRLRALVDRADDTFGNGFEGDLDRAPDGAPRHGSGAYDVEPVLAGLVALRRPGGEQLGLHVAAGLRARGDSAVLAQVVTNLLANCERHAPGAPIGIRALRRGAIVAVELRDGGPGLPADIERSVFDRGVRDEGTGGSGLGLPISRRLMAREGGTVTLRTVDGPRGCLATVTVPAAEPAPAPPLTGEAPLDPADPGPGHGDNRDDRTAAGHP
ncbi:MAG: HAMP domain-containing histidine kinase [Pseudonocardia sp.]|nr:HAMP domain-containing histidine kinase [Pseudonocardia sp.]